MTDKALRQALAAFLGEDRFRAFVRQGIRRGKLRYWQEQEWTRFTAAHPQFALDREELAAVVCFWQRQGEGWRRGERSATIAVALAGGSVGLSLHLAIAYACWLLYIHYNPPNGELFQYIEVYFYAGLALCPAPLTTIYGGWLGVRCARSWALLLPAKPHLDSRSGSKKMRLPS